MATDDVWYQVLTDDLATALAIGTGRSQQDEFERRTDIEERMK